jgi:hypothetical protein
MSAPAAEAEQAKVEVEMPWRRLRITKGALPPTKTFCDMALRIQAAGCIDGNPRPAAMTLRNVVLQACRQPAEAYGKKDGQGSMFPATCM